jgi:predicted nucleic acid-binding protein
VILYLDTSSLVKLYVDETGSEEVRRLVGQADLVATSVVAYAEARAALARRRREKVLKPAGYRRSKAALEADWHSILTLEVVEPLAKHAGELAERHRLRGFDALHLASYLLIVREFAGDEVRFSSADRVLDRAARRSARPRQRVVGG